MIADSYKRLVFSPLFDSIIQYSFVVYLNPIEPL